jgi:hypothetical protein
MNVEDYQKNIKYTFLEEYPIYFLEMFMKKLSDESIIYNDKRKNYSKELLDLTQFTTEKEKMEYLFNNDTSIIKKCEEFEYERAYRYSYLYKFNEIDYSLINQLSNKDKIVEFSEDDKSNDVLDTLIKKPTYKMNDKEILLKFNVELKSKIENEQQSMKHVILVRIDRDSNTIEVRQDVVPIKYQNYNNFYIQKLREVRAWIQSFLKCRLEELDFQAIARYMKINKQDDVKITAIRIERNGMIAELDSAKNIDLEIPILDELRKIIDSKEVFNANEQTLEIKKILEDFMTDIEDNSLMPAVKILWKGLGYEISSYHDKIEGQECFIKWNKTLRDKESMDYVAKYFIKCERELREELED